MRRAGFLAILVAMLAPLSRAGDADFKAIVQNVESNLGIRRTNIPLFGVAMFFVKASHPSGVNQLEMAIFDELNYTPPDARRFEAIMQRAVGDAWSPLVRVQSRRDHELTYIYVKPESRHCKMILATFEPGEAVLMHLKVNPEALTEALDEPRHAGESLGGERKK